MRSNDIQTLSHDQDSAARMQRIPGSRFGFLDSLSISCLDQQAEVSSSNPLDLLHQSFPHDRTEGSAVITSETKRWAAERAAPTLLIYVDPAVGLTEATVSKARAWAERLGLEGAEPSTGRMRGSRRFI